MEGLVNEFFCDFRSVGIGGVDEVDAGGYGSAKDRMRVVAALRLSPGPFADEAHGSVTKAMSG